MYVTKSHNRLLTRTVAPAAEPLTLSTTKTYLRIDTSDEDTLITDLIVAARMNAENWLRHSLISQQWKLGYDDCLPLCIGLPMGPVSALDAVSIVNRDSSTQIVSSDSYSLNSAKNNIVFDTQIIGFHIEITYDTGYGNDPDNVPAPIRQGMLCHVASLYENRGDSGDGGLPDQTISLYTPFREVLL